MKKYVDGTLVDMTAAEMAAENARVKNPAPDYRILREKAYLDAGITLNKLIELRSEIDMYTLMDDIVMAQEKQGELNALLTQKQSIRNLYPKT